MCRDVCTSIAEELIPLFLTQTGRLPIVLPYVIVDLLLATTLQGLSRSTCLPHLAQSWQEPSAPDQRMELAGFFSRGRCVRGSSARSIVRSLV